MYDSAGAGFFEDWAEFTPTEEPREAVSAVRAHGLAMFCRALYNAQRVPLPHMIIPRRSRLARLLSGALLLACSSAALAADYFNETTGITVFAFDNVSIPYSQNLRLEMRTPEKHRENPVVRRGEPGMPDAMAVQFTDR